MRSSPDKTALVGVLDLSTGVDPVAAGLAGTSRAGASARVALHRVRAATLLTARSQDARVEVALSSQNVDTAGEDALLTTLSASLGRLRAEGGALVTFNGRRHDLPILQRRLMRHMLFATDGARQWLEPDAPHLDLMTDLRPPIGRWPSLRDEAAGLGIALPSLPPTRDAAACAAQCELDCAVTYLVHLHIRAAVTGDGAALLAGWRGLAAAIDAANGRLGHLASLRRPAGLSDEQWQALK